MNYSYLIIVRKFVINLLEIQDGIGFLMRMYEEEKLVSKEDIFLFMVILDGIFNNLIFIINELSEIR